MAAAQSALIPAPFLSGPPLPLAPVRILGHNPPMEKARLIWWVYIIRTEDNHLYSGVTTDVARRFREHRAGGARAARYLKAHPPRALVFSLAVGSRSLAQKVEYRLKRLTRGRKEEVIRNQRLVFNSVNGRITE